MGFTLNLVVLRGDQVIGRHTFVSAQHRSLKLGRLPVAQVQLDDTSCADMHAVVELGTGTPVLIDMGTAAGSWVNGVRVGRQALAHGDRLQLGDLVLVVGIDAPAPGVGEVPAAAGSPAPAADGAAGPTFPTASPGAAGSAPALQGAAGAPAAIAAATPAAFGGGTTSLEPKRPAVPPPAASARGAGPYAGGTGDAGGLAGSGSSDSAGGLDSSGSVGGSGQSGSAGGSGNSGNAGDPSNSGSAGGSGNLGGSDHAGHADATPRTPQWQLPADAVDADDGSTVLELRFFWRDALLGMYHYNRPKSVTIGESRRANVFLSSTGLPVDHFPLVRRQQEDYILSFTEAMTGEVQLGGATYPLAQARTSLAKPDPHLDATYQLLMPADCRALVHWGGASMALRFVARPKLAAASWGKLLDLHYVNALILSFVAHLALILTLQIYPYDSRALDVDLFGDPDRFAQLLLTAPEDNKTTADLLAKIQQQVANKRAEIAPPPSKTPPPAPRTASSSRASKPAAEADRREAVSRRFANLLGGSASGGAPKVGGGGGGSLAGTLQNVIGTAGSGSTAAALAGLAAQGDQDSTGGAAGSSRGLASIGTQGRLGGGGTGYGSGVGLGKGRAHDPIDMDTPTVEGSLAPELIAKVVRDNRNQLRYCYELALAHNQNLQGRIVFRWIIGGSGSVEHVSIKETSMHNASVESCMKDKIKHWQFPAPAGGGTVEVTYPFVFQAG